MLQHGILVSVHVVLLPSLAGPSPPRLFLSGFMLSEDTLEAPSGLLFIGTWDGDKGGAFLFSLSSVLALFGLLLSGQVDETSGHNELQRREHCFLVSFFFPSFTAAWIRTSVLRSSERIDPVWFPVLSDDFFREVRTLRGLASVFASDFLSSFLAAEPSASLGLVMIDRIYFLLRVLTTFKEMMEDDDDPGHYSIAYRNLLSLLLVGWRYWKQISILYKFPQSKYICFYPLEWKVALLYPFHHPCFMLLIVFIILSSWHLMQRSKRLCYWSPLPELPFSHSITCPGGC